MPRTQMTTHPQRLRSWWQMAFLALLAAGTLGLAGCDNQSASQSTSAPQTTETAPATAPAFTPPPQPEAPQRPLILFLGDSLTAGLGLESHQAYPALIQQRLDDAGYDYEVANGGISGDTTSGGRSRMNWMLRQPVDIFVVALGSNDGLRGVGVEVIESNLEAIITQAQKSGATVVLAGAMLPTNFGEIYRTRFADIYPRLAQKMNLAFIPFLLEGVAGERHLNQRDGIHPNVEGAKILAENVWLVLEPLLKKN